MNEHRFAFDDLEMIAARIQRLTEDAAYLVLQDRTVRGKDVRVGRFDLTEEDARPWLDELARQQAAGWGDEEDRDPSADDDGDHADVDAEDDSEGDGDDEGGSVFEIEPDLTWGQIKAASLAWLQDTAIRHTAGQSARRFRLKILGPKGTSLIDSGHFGCRDRSHRRPLHGTEPHGEGVAPQPPGLPALPPMPQQGHPANPATDPLAALSTYYTQFGHIVLGTIGQLQGINNSMVIRLSGDLNRSRDQVEELVGAVLESRAAQLEQAHSHTMAHNAADARTALAREAIHNFGDAARALLGAPNLPAELGGLVKVVGQHPELLQTLSDPSVMALLEDRSHVTMLTGVLKQFAAQAQAMKGASGSETPPAQGLNPPSESHPPASDG